ncbi:hypothetical protein SLA2020_288970 [Shorea laevis]
MGWSWGRSYFKPLKNDNRSRRALLKCGGLKSIGLGRSGRGMSDNEGGGTDNDNDDNNINLLRNAFVLFSYAFIAITSSDIQENILMRFFLPYFRCKIFTR